MGILCNLAVNPPNEKLQVGAIECLKHLQQLPELDTQMKRIGGHELVMLLGEQNKF